MIHVYKNIYKSLGFLLGICLSTNSLFADTPLGLEDALSKAAAANPGLKALQARHAAAEARVDGADSLPDPRLQVSFFGESIQTRTGPQDRAYSLSQTIPWFAKLSAREQRAMSDAEIYAAAYDSGRLMLTRDVRIAYYETAYLDKAVSSVETHLKLLEDLHAVVEEQVRSGKSANALLRLEVEMERQRDRLETHRAMVAGKVAELQSFWSAGNEQAFQVGDLLRYRPEPLEPLELKPLQSLLIKQNPDLNGLRQAMTKAGQEARLAKLERYPDFTFGLNYIEVDDVGYNVPDAGKDPWSVSVAVNLPIWAGKNRAQIRSALAERQSAESILLGRTYALKGQLAKEVAIRNNAAERVGRFEQRLIPLAEQALENTRSGYTSGSLGILDLIDSERALIELQLSYWRALADLVQSDARIHALTANSNT